MKERREKRDSLSAPGVAVGCGLAFVLVYLVPFFAVLIDELVLESCWFVRFAPEWTKHVFGFVYWPLIEVVRQLLD